MITAFRLALEEMEDTETDVLFLSEQMNKFGFDKINGHANYQDTLNKRGKPSSRQYRRV